MPGRRLPGEMVIPIMGSIVGNGAGRVNFQNGKNRRCRRFRLVEKPGERGEDAKKMRFFQKNGQEKLEMPGKGEYNILLYVEKSRLPSRKRKGLFLCRTNI